MSERGGGGGTPGNPPRIPGIPSNASIDRHIFEFRTLNAQRPRPSIQDQEMAWCQNLMPIGAYYLRAIPDHSSPIFVTGPPPQTEGVKFQGSATPILALDGITNGRITQKTTAPYSGTCGPLTTMQPNDWLVLITSAEKLTGTDVSPPVITSIVSTSGLMWKKRSSVTNTILSDYYPGLIYSVVEMWYAIAPHPLTSETITITYDQPITFRNDSAIFGCFAVAGVNIDAGWDGTTQSSSSNSYASVATLAVAGVTTANDYDLIFSYFVGFRNPVLSYAVGTVAPWGIISGGSAGGSNVPGWVDAEVVVVGSNTGAWNQCVAFETVFNSPQTNLTVYGYGQPEGGSAFVGIADAVQGYSTTTETELTIPSLANLPATADTLLIAGWIGFVYGGVGTNYILADTGAGGLSLSFTNSGVNSTWTLVTKAADGSPIANVSVTVSNDDLRTGWHSFAVSAKMSTNTAQLLLDATLHSMTGTWSSSNPVGYPALDGWRVGPIGLLADFSSLWFDAGAPFFDLSVTANVQILFGTSNCWLFWGPEGETINGSRPPLFLAGDRISYPLNLGSGGSFTVTGQPLANVTGPTVCPP